MFKQPVDPSVGINPLSKGPTNHPRVAQGLLCPRCGIGWQETVSVEKQNHVTGSLTGPVVLLNRTPRRTDHHLGPRLHCPLTRPVMTASIHDNHLVRPTVPCRQNCGRDVPFLVHRRDDHRHCHRLQPSYERVLATHCRSAVA